MPEGNIERRKEPESSRSLTRRNRDWWPEWRSEAAASNPLVAMRRMLEEMNRDFGRMQLSERSNGDGDSWWPSMEVQGQDGKLVVRADLPGVSKEDVKVEVAEGDLLIQGKRKREHEEKGQGYYRSERSYGSFSRCIPLPEGAKTDQATARFNDGVLEISIPVPETKTKGREIPIEASQKK
ncbi:Hsp20/alpha crystallin family protein [Bryobacter aggregatus]|uniref:Hsp20/alpha crystallin family protein n=1 Tax=Bryobacter aggregatus TaxID=360054 RepID=UPI0006918D44|nr:Hsp20/alpha crystallin family protein [Bryobacter aggregatus]